MPPTRADLQLRRLSEPLALPAEREQVAVDAVGCVAVRAMRTQMVDFRGALDELPTLR
jgi:hypothetical protein